MVSLEVLYLTIIYYVHYWFSFARGSSLVAMYCTDGIHCEKASSFLFNKVFKKVSHECSLHCYHLSIKLLLSATKAVPTNLIVNKYTQIIFCYNKLNANQNKNKNQ